MPDGTYYSDRWMFNAGVAMGSVRSERLHNDKKVLHDLIDNITVVGTMLEVVNQAILNYRDPRNSSYFGATDPASKKLAKIEKEAAAATIDVLIKRLKDAFNEVQVTLRKYDKDVTDDLAKTFMELYHKITIGSEFESA